MRVNRQDCCGWHRLFSASAVASLQKIELFPGHSEPSGAPPNHPKDHTILGVMEGRGMVVAHGSKNALGIVAVDGRHALG